jgi:hypothetical protein
VTAVFQPADLRAFCRQGVPVSFKGVSTYADDGSPICGLFDRPVDFKLQTGGVEGVETALPELRLPCNAFSPMPQDGDQISVAGATYVCNQPQQEDDGAFFCYALTLP